MLNKYYEYILESYLRTSDRLKDLLINLKDPVADKLVSLIDTDIRTNYNALDYLTKAEEKGKLSFLQDSQFNNKLKTISDYKELISDKNNSATVGKIVKGILKDNGITTTDKEIDAFVNKFKASVNEEDEIKIVKGEDIRYWYLESNYYGKDGGTLWNSCMRHARCQKFLDIYVKNENISLVIVLKEGKLVARALIWEGVNGDSEQYYLDRVYYYSDDYNQLVRNWAIKNISDDILLYPHSNLSISLEKYDFNYYPYMDTFDHSDDEGNFNSYDDGEWEYNDTGGGRSSVGGVYSDLHGYSLDEDDAWWSEHYNDYVDPNNDDVIWSSSRQEYYLRDDCVRLRSGDYILEDDALEVISEDGSVYVDPDDGDYYEYDGEYYLWEYGVDTITDDRVPPTEVIELVNIRNLEDEPEKVRNFITMLYKNTDFVDPEISDIFSLTETHENSFISKQIMPLYTISTTELVECYLLLEELKEDKVIDADEYRYIKIQMDIVLEGAMDKPRYEDNELFSKFSQEEVLNVWKAVVKVSWDQIFKDKEDETLRSIISMYEKTLIRKYVEALRPYYKDMMEDPLKYTQSSVSYRLYKKTGFNINKKNLIYALIRLYPFVVNYYQSSMVNDNSMFPMKKEEKINNLIKLKLSKYYLQRL